MLDATGQTGLKGSRASKSGDKGFFFLNGQIPVLNGDGIVLEYVDLTTGETIDPNLNPWNSQTKIGLRISKA
jgi:hypothetical protein